MFKKNKFGKKVAYVKNEFIRFCESLTGPVTLYAFGAIIFQELSRLQETNPELAVTFDHAFNAISSAALFGFFIIVVSMTWMAISFYDWIISLEEELYQSNKKETSSTLIKGVIALLIVLFLFIVFTVGVWGASTIIFFR